ncbi:MAG: hypothetical protein WCQ21_17260 [Verrucomicrobiota bacterium]|jgi:hypothetical protein
MKPIIGAGGKLRGYIKESDDRIELLAPGGRMLGIYLVSSDQTIRPGGGLVGYGNVLLTLLED